MKLSPLEERVYRFRCVEAWSMVIPWVGFPLSALIKQAEPTGNAKFIQFVTLLDPKRMPGQKPGIFGNALTGLTLKVCDGRSHASADDPFRWDSTGNFAAKWRADPCGGAMEIRLQEHQIHRQNPLRRKATEDRVEHSCSRKSMAFTPTSIPRSITRAGVRPRNAASASFYAAKTLMFNGYGEQVASLYKGMDLKKYY